MTSKKPRVITACVASQYAMADERIIEVSHELSGCLISIRPKNGRLLIEVYRADDTVDVSASERNTVIRDSR